MRKVDAFTEREAIAHHHLARDDAGIGRGVREEQQQRAPGGELEPGAVRHEERGRDHEQEHEEQQRTPVAPGAGHRHGEHEPVDQDQQRHERPGDGR